MPSTIVNTPVTPARTLNITIMVSTKKSTITVAGTPRLTPARVPLAVKSVNVPASSTPLRKSALPKRPLPPPTRAPMPRMTPPLARLLAQSKPALAPAKPRSPPPKTPARQVAAPSKESTPRQPSYAAPTKSMASRITPPRILAKTPAQPTPSRAIKARTPPARKTVLPSGAPAPSTAATRRITSKVAVPRLAAKPSTKGSAIRSCKEVDVLVKAADIKKEITIPKESKEIEVNIKEEEKLPKDASKSNPVEEVLKTKLEEKITTGLQSWTPAASAQEGMVVTEIVQTDNGVRRMRKYIIEEEIIKEEDKPKPALPKRWSFTAKEVLDSLRRRSLGI